MGLLDALWPYGSLGNPIEDGKRAQMDHRLDSSRTFQMGVDNLREAQIGDKVIIRVPKPFKPAIEGEYSVVEIDGKKLLEEMK